MQYEGKYQETLAQQVSQSLCFPQIEVPLTLRGEFCILFSTQELPQTHEQIQLCRVVTAEGKTQGSLHTVTVRDIRLGTMVMLLLSSLDSQEYSPSSSARIPVIVRVRLVPSSRIWKRLLGLTSTPFLLHVTFPLAWLSSQLRDTLPPISAFTASSFLANFTGISEIQEKGKA